MNASNNHDEDSSIETEEITEAEFYKRNINHDNDENAILGFSFLRLVRRDPTIKSLTVTNECACSIERAGLDVNLYRDTLTDDQIKFLESLGFEVDDYSENAPVIGRHIANLPNLHTIILEDARSCLMDSEYKDMFQEASGSTSIKTLIFRRCRLDQCFGVATDVFATILYTEGVKEVTFENCTLDYTFIEILNEVAYELHWSMLRFEQCKFKHHLMHHIVAEKYDTRMTKTLIFNQCQSISANGEVFNIPSYQA